MRTLRFAAAWDPGVGGPQGCRCTLLDCRPERDSSYGYAWQVEDWLVRRLGQPQGAALLILIPESLAPVTNRGIRESVADLTAQRDIPNNTPAD